VGGNFSMSPFRSLKKRLARGLEEKHPMLKALMAGEISISASTIEGKLRERFAKRSSAVSFVCEAGVAWFLFEKEDDGESKTIAIPVVVEELTLKRGRQRAVLLFPDDLRWDGSTVALTDLINPEEFAETVAERSEGMIEIDWPQATLYFERHPELSKALTTRMGPFPALVDAFEITECRIEPGRVVLPIHRPKKKS